MPIYEYACAACGHEFEEWQKMSDAPVKTCPKCKKKKVERLISRTAFQLKGGGWYADLYSSSKPGESKGDAAESKAESKDSGASAKDDAKGSKDSGNGATASEGPSKSAGKTSDSAGSSASTKKKIAKKAESRAA